MNDRLSFISYQLQNGKWVPKVLVRTYVSNEVKEQTFTWDKHFGSKKEADDFAKLKAIEAGKEG